MAYALISGTSTDMMLSLGFPPPVHPTKSLLQSANSFSLIAPSFFTKNRGLDRIIAFFSIAWFSLSINICGSLHMSRYPNAAGEFSTGNSVSSTNGYLP